MAVYDPTNGGQNANNFAPGGWYNPLPPASIGSVPGQLPPPATIGSGFGSMPVAPGSIGSTFGTMPGQATQPIPMPILGVPPTGGNPGNKPPFAWPVQPDPVIMGQQPGRSIGRQGGYRRPTRGRTNIPAQYLQMLAQVLRQPQQQQRPLNFMNPQTIQQLMGAWGRR